MRRHAFTESAAVNHDSLRRVPLLLSAAVLVSCTSEPPADDDAYERVISFDTAHVRLARQGDTLRLALQLAVSDEQKTMGLMERRRLGDYAGMLFVYGSTQPPDAGFWMYRTRIPLDIAFLDSAGVVRAVRSMTPCPSTIARRCPTYTPDVPYRYALEVNAGFFAQHGITIGHSLLLRDLPGLSPGSEPAPSKR
jgi:uncharacterized membrane protein (UPF0127 family)